MGSEMCIRDRCGGVPYTLRVHEPMLDVHGETKRHKAVVCGLPVVELLSPIDARVHTQHSGQGMRRGGAAPGIMRRKARVALTARVFEEGLAQHRSTQERRKVVRMRCGTGGV